MSQSCGKKIFLKQCVTSPIACPNWTVLRFWSADIEKKLEQCVGQIQQVLPSRPQEIGGR